MSAKNHLFHSNSVKRVREMREKDPAVFDALLAHLLPYSPAIEKFLEDQTDTPSRVLLGLLRAARSDFRRVL